MTKFETVVRVVTACTSGVSIPKVSAQFECDVWTIRISDQHVVYKGKTLDEACDSLLTNWGTNAGRRILELETMTLWLREAYS